MSKAEKDHLIEMMINDPEYDIRPDGTIWTNRPKSGPKKPGIIYPWRRLDRDGQKPGYRIATCYGSYVQVHRVIYRKFIGPLDHELTVNHKNGNKSDNVPNNLELITTQENTQHMVDIGLSLKAENNPQAYFTNDEVREIKTLLSQNISVKEISRRFGVDHTRISNIKTGRTYSSV